MTDGIGAPRRFIGLDVDMKWYEDYLTHRSSEVRCAVCLTDPGQLVGMVSLTRMDYVHRDAELHALVGAEVQNEGGSARRPPAPWSVTDSSISTCIGSI